MPAPHRAFTLVELLVVIAIIMILAGLGMSGLGVVRESARSSACCSNQRQIVLGMLAFRQDHDGEWPGTPTIRRRLYTYIERFEDGRPRCLAQSPVIYGDCNAWVPMASLEVLAAWSNGDLTRRQFTCPTSRTGPRVEANPRMIEEFEVGCEPQEFPLWQDLCDSAYCYDDRVGGGRSAVRVVLGDRPIDPSCTAHGQRTNVAFADGHTSTLRRSGNNGCGGRFREWKDTYEWITMEVVNELAGDDNIYDPIGDGIYADANDQPARSIRLSTRSWLR